jgi:hypothetical protein
MAFWTSALIKMLVSRAFLITLSKMISIYESVCLPSTIISSFKQSNAFLDTLDLRFSTRERMSMKRLWMTV